MLTITLPELKRQIRLAQRPANYCQLCKKRAGWLRQWGKWLVCEVCWGER